MTIQSVPLITPAAGSTGAQRWRGGPGAFTVVGAFAGASVQLQFLGPDGRTWIDAGAPLTAPGLQQFALPCGDIQAVVSGEGASLTGEASPIPAGVIL